MVVYHKKTTEGAVQPWADSATGPPHSTGGARVENGPSLALLVHVLKIVGYARDRGEVRIWKYMNDERNLHAIPKWLTRRQRNHSQSAAPMIIRFSIERLMLVLIENKRRRVERWRGVRRLQKLFLVRTYERVLKLMSPCHGVVKGTDVNSQLMQAASAPYALHLG